MDQSFLQQNLFFIPPEWMWVAQLIKGTTMYMAPYVVGYGTFTPEACEVILRDHNKNNRDIRPKALKKYTFKMKSREWILNGEAIIFDLHGQLRNGQHRLMACIRAGVAFDSFYTCGVRSPTFHSYDSHSKRTVADYLKTQGVKQPHITSSALALLYTFMKVGIFDRHVPAYENLDPSNWFTFLQEHHQLEESAAFTHKLGNDVRDLFGGPGTLATLHYLFHRVSTTADAFFENIANRSIPPEAEWSAVKALAKKIADERVVAKREETKISPARIAAYAVKAWNSLMNRRPLSRIPYKPGEDFPQIRGWAYGDDGLPSGPIGTFQKRK